MRCYANVSRHLIAQHDTPRSAGDLIHNVTRSDIENSLKKETKEPTVTNPRPSIKRSRGLHALPSSTHNFRISETTPRYNDIFQKKKNLPARMLFSNIIPLSRNPWGMPAGNPATGKKISCCPRYPACRCFQGSAEAPAGGPVIDKEFLCCPWYPACRCSQDSAEDKSPQESGR